MSLNLGSAGVLVMTLYDYTLNFSNTSGCSVTSGFFVCILLKTLCMFLILKKGEGGEIEELKYIGSTQIFGLL